MKLIYESDDLAAIRAQARRFVEEQIVPRAEEWERAGSVPREVLRQMGDLGFFALRVPESHGGLGLGELASLVLAEELGRSTFGGFSATALVHTDLAMPYLLNYGSDVQLDRWVPDLLSGSILTAIAVTEPDAGSDVGSIRTSARRDGEGWILNGTKMFITNGVSADLVFVAAKTDPDARSSRSISILAVEKEMDGFTVSRSLDKMGWRSSDTAELVFADCWVPDTHVIGEVNHGFYAIMNNFQNERLVLAGMALGEMARALELTVSHVRERRAFGAPLWEKQAVRQRLATRAAELDAARTLTYHAAWLRESGHDAVAAVSKVKAFVGELTNRLMYDCVQFHGGMGYISETAIERMYRDARIHSIGGGATEVMLDEVAKRM